MRKISLFLTLLLGFCLVFSFGFKEKPVNDAKGKPNLVPDEIIVKFTQDVSEDAKNNLKTKYGLLKKADSYKKGDFVVYKYKNPQAILSQLKKEPGVIYVEQNGYAYAAMIPNDPYYSPYQWHMTRIGMESAWDMQTGSGVVVAIVDTGVKQSLEDLANTNFMAGYDFINNDNDPTDDEGHGSHVCGTVAQSTNNNIGVTGIAYNCTIMPVKVLDQNGNGSYDAIANGIIYATDNGADIINMSLRGLSPNTTLENAVNYAWNNGVVVISAAGNDYSNIPVYPASYTNSMSVTATNYLDQKADYSNWHSTVDICAPGGDGNDYNGDGYMDGVLQNTFSGTSEGYYFYTGTSMATPHVVGVAALVKAANPALTNAEIRNILETTAEDLGTSGWDQYFGHGIVDAPAAIQAAGSGNQFPVADFTFSTNLLTVTFTDQSYDPDGYIASWDWDFGDGGSSGAQNPVHTYASSGTYSVTLTVTDNEGATDDITKDVTVSDGNEPDIYVFDISQTVSKKGVNYYSTAVITIKDDTGALVSGATVSISWSGVVSGTDSGTTGAGGTVTFTSANARKQTGPFTITVTNVSHPTMNYNPALNNETSDTAYY